MRTMKENNKSEDQIGEYLTKSEVANTSGPNVLMAEYLIFLHTETKSKLHSYITFIFERRFLTNIFASAIKTIRQEV